MPQLLTISTRLPPLAQVLAHAEKAYAWVLEGFAETPFLPPKVSAFLERARASADQETCEMLPAECVYQTVISLPRSMTRNIAAAINLQMDELCPFPIADAATAYQVLTTEKERVQVAVAFARQADIDAHQSRLVTSGSHCVAAASNGSDKPFVFQRTYPPITRARLRPILSAGAVTAASLALIAAISFRFNHELERLQTTEQNLILEAKAAREVLAETDEIIGQRQVLENRITLSEFANRLSALNENASSSLRLSAFSHGATGTVYEGHLSDEEAMVPGNFRELSRSPDASRPGWVTVKGVFTPEEGHP